MIRLPVDEFEDPTTGGVGHPIVKLFGKLMDLPILILSLHLLGKSLIKIRASSKQDESLAWSGGF